MSQSATDQEVSVFQGLGTAKLPEQGLDTLIEEWRNSFDGLFDDEPGDTASVHIKSTGIVSTWYGQAHEAHGTAWEQQHQEVATELTLYYSRWPKGLV